VATTLVAILGFGVVVAAFYWVLDLAVSRVTTRRATA
jgi:hypothetical protein